MKRSSGILLPIFSLPSRQGIGTLGQEAYNFLDFLNASGQSHWQMLPVGPTGFGDSPYQCFSSHAGNPYFIDLDLLVSEGLLKQREVDELHWGSIPDKVDYGIIYKNKNVILKKAFDRFLGICGQESTRYCKFCEENLDWLADYALFISLKQHFNMLPWYEWDGNIRRRYPAALERYKELLKDQIEFHMFVQYIFYSQWEMMQLYAKEKKVNLIGDLPIYIPMDSADAWVESDILQFDEEGNPTAVGGVPPDYFSKTGQLWGNPLYDWKKIKDSGYIWWMKRLASAAKLFDCIRLDHFRGFESYYSIPYGEKTAINGKWMPGVGMDFISLIKRRFPNLDIIAEDLGSLTDEVRQLVKESGFPGMQVLQFAFDSGSLCDYLPHRYIRNSVVYTGTHDNTTIKGWLDEEAKPNEREYVQEYFGLHSLEGWNWGIIKGAMRSVADLCIIPIQDYLDLPGSARINTPGTVGGNWQWRLTKGQLTSGLAEKIQAITESYGR